MTGNVKNTRSMRLHPCDSILYTDLGAWSEVWTEGGKEEKKDRTRTKEAETKVERWEGKSKHRDRHVKSEYRAPNQHRALRNTWMF